MINLVVIFFLANSPLQVQYVQAYATPHLCMIALEAKRWTVPKVNGKPVKWDYVTAGCQVTQ